MRYLFVTILLMLTPAALLAADFNAGMAAFERQDYATAIKEFGALAKAGDLHAQYMLGRLYAQGNGVVQDYVQAHKWYNLAASQGHSHAAEARDALAKQMTSAQISQAQRLASKWKPGANVASMETPPAAESNAPAPADSTGRRLLLHDAFQDGDYTKSPTWTVTAGQFSVDKGIGLRSVYEPRRPPAETRLEDLPIAILGAILGEANHPDGSTTPADPPDYAEIYVAAPITNAFSMGFKLTLRQPAPGPLAFGPYQGKGQTGGYRLVYTPNEARGLHLVRMTGSGSSVIESVDPKFSLNRQYAIQWSRDRQGEMAVSLDGKEVFRATDRSFMDRFDGFTLINRGGDYVLREIAIYSIK